MKKVNKKNVEPYFNINISDRWLKLSILFIIFSSVIYLVFVLMEALNKNGYFSFPLDDPWIHLQFAKNFYQYGEFSYFKDSAVTSGSTAPLYTFLLALGFLFTQNEFILSYSLGIIFFIGSIIYFYRILVLEFQGNNLIIFLGTLLFAFIWKIQWAAISGMETTTAIFFLLGSIYFYKKEKWILLSIFAGMFLWVRPEAIIFYGVLLINFVYHKYWTKDKNILNLKHYKFFISISLFLLIVISYFIFNLTLSGSLFPNTFSAKIKYYSGGNVNYLEQLINLFSEDDIIVLSIFSAIGFIAVFYKIILRKQNNMLIYASWSLGLILAFGLFLPYLYQKGRYLFPIYPAFTILGLYGIINFFSILKNLIKSLTNKKVYLYSATILLVLIFTQFLYASISFKNIYIDDVKYIHDRQITTARWIEKNLPLDAVVATHDIGAMAYYSNRQIVDMVGLVSPEMIPNIGSFQGLKKFLNSKQVTHVVTLRNWFHIGNQNPIYITDENNPEVMEVFEYKHNSEFVPQSIVKINEEAEFFIRTGDIQRAMFLLNQSLNYYPNLDWTNFLIAKVFIILRDDEKAKVFLENTLKLNPQHNQAKILLHK